MTYGKRWEIRSIVSLCFEAPPAHFLNVCCEYRSIQKMESAGVCSVMYLYTGPSVKYVTTDVCFQHWWDSCLSRIWVTPSLLSFAV